MATSPIFATRDRCGRPREARSHTNASVRVLAVCLAKYPLRGSHHQLRTPCCRPPDCRRLTSTRLRYHLGMYGRARPQEGKPATPKCDHPADPFRRGDARGCRRITRHRRSGGRNWISLTTLAFPQPTEPSSPVCRTFRDVAPPEQHGVLQPPSGQARRDRPQFRAALRNSLRPSPSSTGPNRRKVSRPRPRRRRGSYRLRRLSERFRTNPIVRRLRPGQRR